MRAKCLMNYNGLAARLPPLLHTGRTDAPFARSRKSPPIRPMSACAPAGSMDILAGELKPWREIDQLVTTPQAEQ